MIAWMQKHNKYLVITIWIATIAFIGAGFVGWGTYQYGKKASALAEVGTVPVTRDKFDLTYRNYYQRYNDLYRGKFDQKKAKELGLDRQVMEVLVRQALLLNAAKEYGIVVTDDEIARYLASLPQFQSRGRFDRRTYDAYLEQIGLQARNFEAILRDELTIDKFMKLANKPSLAFEQKVVASALGISDTIRYRVLRPDDVNVTLDDARIRSYWEKHKKEYLTPKTYRLSILWTDTKGIAAGEKELKDFYLKNSFNYVDKNGKSLPYEKVKEAVSRDYRIKKGKKQALLDYIAFKKGKAPEGSIKTLEVPEHAATLSPELWKEIESSSVGKVLKPKPVGERYATVRIEKIEQPVPMKFEEAKNEVKKRLVAQLREQKLEQQARALLKSKEPLPEKADSLSMGSFKTLKHLSQQESLQFLQKLFTSKDKKGIIRLTSGDVVYEIVDQKLKSADENLTGQVAAAADRIKKGEFEQNLVEELSKKYPVRKFVKGL